MFSQYQNSIAICIYNRSLNIFCKFFVVRQINFLIIPFCHRNLTGPVHMLIERNNSPMWLRTGVFTYLRRWEKDVPLFIYS